MIRKSVTGNRKQNQENCMSQSNNRKKIRKIYKDFSEKNKGNSKLENVKKVNLGKIFEKLEGQEFFGNE